MRIGKRVLSLLLSAVMASSLALTGVSAAGLSGAAADDGLWQKPEYTDAVDYSGVDQTLVFEGGSWSKVTDDGKVQLENGGDLHASTDLVEVIVVLEEQPLIKAAAGAGMEGDVAAYLSTAQAVSEEQQLLRALRGGRHHLHAHLRRRGTGHRL